MNSISVLILFLIISLSLSAHEVRPAYFSVTQISDSTFQIVWKIQALGTSIQKIYPVQPDNGQIREEQTNLLPGNLRRT